MNIILKDIVAEHLCIRADDICETSLLADDLGADSFDLIEIAITIEDKFDIRLDDDQIECCQTFADLEKLVAA